MSAADVRIEKDIIYAHVSGRELKLDVYWHPEAAAPEPLIVWIHGGAWRRGSKENPRAKMMLDQGYAVASVEYRLSGEAIFPAQINDCKAAVRWLRANAGRFNVDGDRIGAWGPSAGGHLVAMLGTTGDVVDLEGDFGTAGVSSRVQAVCDWFGPTDLLRMNDLGRKHSGGDTPNRIDHDAPDSPESQLIGGTLQDHPEKAERANPITYVTADDPPFLIMHGRKDFTVRQNQSELLHAALQEKDVPSTLVIVDDLGHGLSSDPDVTKHVTRFFDQHLRAKTSDWAQRGENPRPWVPPLDSDAKNARSVMFPSKLAGGYYTFTVMLPDSYGGGKTYPVAYWLHGRNGRPHTAKGFMRRALQAMRDGLCPEMVIVGVNGLQGSMYTNSKDGRLPVASVMMDELIPYVEATYEVDSGRDRRAIDGFSMGGYGAAYLGFTHPEAFAAISILGAAVHKPAFFASDRKEIFTQTFGDDLAYCTKHSPWTLMEGARDALRGKIIRIHVGENDERLRDKNIAFHETAERLGIAHDFSVVEKARHNSGQVLDGLDDPWAFYRQAFGE